MRRTPITGIVLLGVLAASGLTAPAAGAPKGGSTTAPRTILVQVRHESGIDLRTMTETGGSAAQPVTGIVAYGRPRWSPDGTRIGGYHRSPTGDWAGGWDLQMVTARADGSDERVVLTADEVKAFNVARGLRSAVGGVAFEHEAYGPDGRTIVFTGMVRYEGATLAPEDDVEVKRLFTVRDNGDATRTIAAVTDGDGAYDDVWPHWSWTRDEIVFVRQPRCACQQELWVVRPDGSGLRQLTDLATSGVPSSTYGGALAAPSWSRAGDRIVVVGDLGYHPQVGQGGLWLVDAATGAVSSLRDVGGASDWSPVWSPDDREILLLRVTKGSRNFRYQLVRLDLGSGTERVVTDSKSQHLESPDWRPAT